MAAKDSSSIISKIREMYKKSLIDINIQLISEHPKLVKYYQEDLLAYLILEYNRKARLNRERLENRKIEPRIKENRCYSLVVDRIKVDGTVAEIIKKIDTANYT